MRKVLSEDLEVVPYVLSVDEIEHVHEMFKIVEHTSRVLGAVVLNAIKKEIVSFNPNIDPRQNEFKKDITIKNEKISGLYLLERTVPGGDGWQLWEKDTMITLSGDCETKINEVQFFEKDDKLSVARVSTDEIGQVNFKQNSELLSIYWMPLNMLKSKVSNISKYIDSDGVIQEKFRMKPSEIKYTDQDILISWDAKNKKFSVQNIFYLDGKTTPVDLPENIVAYYERVYRDLNIIKKEPRWNSALEFLKKFVPSPIKRALDKKTGFGNRVS